MLAQLADQQQPEPVVSDATKARSQTMPPSTLREPSGDDWRQPNVQAYQPALPPLIATPIAFDASSVTTAALRDPRSSVTGVVKTPSLPKLNASTANSDRPITPTHKAMGELNAIGGMVVGWQEELQQLLPQIEAVYAEGPIVDGWLEAYTSAEDAAQTIHPASRPMLLPPASNQPGGCRLCGFGDDGQLWFRHCPREQIADVKLAIERHERLKHLLTRKHNLDMYLDKLTDALVIIREHLNVSQKPAFSSSSRVQ